MDETQIQKMIESYKKKQIREKANYDAKKDMISFKQANQIKSKAYHENNKDKIKERYTNNKDVVNARSLYNYYKKKDMVDIYIERHKPKYDLLVEKGLI